MVGAKRKRIGGDSWGHLLKKATKKQKQGCCKKKGGEQIYSEKGFQN